MQQARTASRNAMSGLLIIGQGGLARAPYQGANRPGRRLDFGLCGAYLRGGVGTLGTRLLTTAPAAPAPSFYPTAPMENPQMKFRPLGDRVLVRRVEEEQKTKGGIIIPDTVKEKPQEGEVIAVGPGARDENGKLVPLDVKAKDVILFGKWSGTEVKIDGEDLLIMKESDVLGVVEK
jgi:chaperonin GroES